MNFLYIHSHDTGRWVQPYGHAVPTPHLQRLAQQGWLFRNAFCANPTCSPSRVCLLTGQYAHTNGMLGLAHRGFRPKDYRHFITHALKRAGYTTALAGIQHEAHPPTADPRADLGYDHFLNHDADANPFHEQTTDAAVEFLAQQRQPFFLSVGYFETHREFPEPDARAPQPRITLPAHLPDLPEVRRDFAAYCAMARTLDEKMGRIFAALDQQGLSENTLVICTTDHGIAFPRMKCNLTDAGIGVMLILRGPNIFGGGRVCDAMVTHLDLYPTLCDLAGVAKPSRLQGKSLLPLALGKTERLHEEIFAEVNFHAAYEPQRCARTDRFKYIRRFDDRRAPVLPNCDDSPTKNALLHLGWRERGQEAEMLFDLALDPNESVNLAADARYAAALLEMRERLARWMRETDDPLLRGPIAPPRGARLNDPNGLSPTEPAQQF
jgi:arylsulfatase A-like enzyme